MNLRRPQTVLRSRFGRPALGLLAGSVAATLVALALAGSLPGHERAAVADRMSPRPVTRTQTAAVDCGPRALLAVCRWEHHAAVLSDLRRAAGTDPAHGGTSLEGMARAARAAGFRAEGVQVDRDALANLTTPAIAWVDGDHYIAVLEIRRNLVQTVAGAPADTAVIRDPDHDREEEMPLTELLSRSGGVLLTLAPER